jgi:hypothetical protein
MTTKKITIITIVFPSNGIKSINESEPGIGTGSNTFIGTGIIII